MITEQQKNMLEKIKAESIMNGLIDTLDDTMEAIETAAAKAGQKCKELETWQWLKDDNEVIRNLSEIEKKLDAAKIFYNEIRNIKRGK